MSAFQQKSRCTLPTPLLLGRTGLTQGRIDIMKSKIDFDQYTDLEPVQLPQEIPFLPHLQTCKNVMDLVKRNIDYFNTISGGGSGETEYCLKITGGADVPWQTPEPFPGTGRLGPEDRPHEYNTCYLCGLPILNKEQAVVTPAVITPEEQQLYNTSKGILEQYSDIGEITLQTLGLLENPINVWAFNSVVVDLKVSNDLLIAQNKTPKNFDQQSIIKKITESYQTHPMYPEGEHVIDYKRAGYMNILSTSGRTFNEKDPLSVAWRHQYAWAHRCCNQFKSQGDFCHWTNGDGGGGAFFYPSSANINAFYKEMAKSDSKYAHVQYFHGPNGPLRRNFLGQAIPYPFPSLEDHLSKVEAHVNSRVNTILSNVNQNPSARLENIFSSECLKKIFSKFVEKKGKGKTLLKLNRAEDITINKDNLLNDWTAIGAGGILLDPGDEGDEATLQDWDEVSGILGSKRKPDDELASSDNKSQRGDDDDEGAALRSNTSALWPIVNKSLKIKSDGKSIIDVGELQESIGAVPVPKREAFKKAAENITLIAVEQAKKRAAWEREEKKLNANIQQVIDTINSMQDKNIKCDDIVKEFVDTAKNWTKIDSRRSGFPDRIISDLHSKFKFILMSDGSIYVEQR